MRARSSAVVVVFANFCCCEDFGKIYKTSILKKSLIQIFGEVLRIVERFVTGFNIFECEVNCRKKYVITIILKDLMITIVI